MNQRETQDCFNCLEKRTDNGHLIAECNKGHKLILTLDQILEGNLDQQCKDCPDFDD